MPPDEEIDFTPDPEEGIDFTPDEPDPVEAPPAPVKAESTAAGNAAWADSLGPGERAAALAAAARRGSSEADRARAQYLLQRHVSQSLGTEDTAAPIVGRDMRGLAGVTGATQGLTLGWADEMRGAARSQAGEGSYQQQRDLARADVTTARTQAPAAYGMGELAGTAPTMAIPGAGAEGIGSRLAAAAATNAGIGTVAGAGHSEAEGLDAAGDALAGGVMGGAFGVGGQLVGEGARAGLGALSRTAAQADRARVASIATGTSRELQDTLVREAQSMPGGVSGVAERLRRLRIVPAVGTAQDVAEGAGRALDDVGEGGILGDAYRSLEGVAPVPRERLLGALDRYAGQVEADPVMRRFGRAVRARSEDFAETLPEEIGYQRAREILRGVGDQTNWIDPVSGSRPPQDIARGTYRALRSELDDVAEEALTRGTGSAATADEFMRDFRRARLDTQAALFADEWSGRAMDRLARNRGVSPTDYLAGAAGAAGEGGSMLRGALAVVSNRTWRLREGTMRATGAELAQRLVQQHPERLGRWAGPLSAAMQRGASAFAAAHMALSSRDPEYRRALETAGEEAADAAQE